LAILKALSGNVKPGVSYEIESCELSNFLEDIFNLSKEKLIAKEGKTYSVIFSRQWLDFIKNQGDSTAKVYDVIVWAYRRVAFDDSITKERLLEKFANDFHLTYEQIEELFSTRYGNVTFNSYPYQESELLSALKRNGVKATSSNITADCKSVIANPGSINRGPFIQPIYTSLESFEYILICNESFNDLYGIGKEEQQEGYDSDKDTKFEFNTLLPLQQIYYGAPGTGKSHEIKKIAKDELVFRTTFHPDTDYASFVGAYKPVMKEVDMKVVPVVLNNGASFNQNEGSFKEKRISYEFVMQPFLQAYVAAWKELADEHPQPVFLVIEEINRGNCAQIFGDIFQLLDRNDEGFSEYPIRTDEDLKGQLAIQFAGLNIDNKDVKEGKVLQLPNNLYIWATMNTSDQSLFPIDSAFKRRWDWKYVPISDAHKDWAIEVGENCYDWWEFLEAINQHIFECTNSEDKKLGYFFCKADSEGYISVEKFVSKVLFYLWNDVFKDYGLERTLFDDAEGGKLSFDKFYTVSEGSIDVDIEKVETFLQNLGIEPIVWDDDYGTVGLRVEWPDGTVIDKPSKKEIYLEALRRIGIERAAEGLSDRYRMEDVPIISKRKNPKVESSKQYNYEKIDNYYVMVGIDNYGSALRQLSDKYNLGLTIVGE
jgi:hypothetical protein